jgi:hypothetical protein
MEGDRTVASGSGDDALEHRPAEPSMAVAEQRRDKRAGAAIEDQRIVAITRNAVTPVAASA